ncbi:hypothetical protein TRFO_31241 [Tritrichomonas foetus]|uniref:F5/8 type C domain-containing protein n=1 Tax=Tritrichomonas foetus TaxID=1144522 RepID=A0A1J4JRY8_9EUKA|nr:hypothetical protein TRFO_31241 [Tritrichomonas foetus]|eukprot:OHT01889.1 hypothetical protein TRFO_31241 [Tritrichomonas foetus]
MEQTVCDVAYSNDPLKGIFTHMTKSLSKNPIQSGFVKVTMPTVTDPFHNLNSIFDYSVNGLNQCIYNYFCGFPTSSQNWIQFDFGSNKVAVSGYTLRNSNRYLTKSWKIIGSNDLENWNDIHEVKEYRNSDKPNINMHFSCERLSESYRFIRFVQNENHDRNPRCKYIIQIAALELFGRVFSN